VYGSGQVANTYRYGPFGQILSQTGSFPNPYLYAGEPYDPETGNYYLQSRYYDPATGRFLTQDTLAGNPADPLNLDLYVYVDNNPLTRVDPTGRASIWQMLQFEWTVASAWGNLVLNHPHIAQFLSAFLPQGSEMVGLTVGFINLPPSERWALVENLPLVGGDFAVIHSRHAPTWMKVLAVADIVSTIDPGKAVAEGVVKEAAKDAIEHVAGKDLIKYERHHLLPRQFSKLFRKAGITNINKEEFMRTLDRETHKLIHGKGGGKLWDQSWNRQWEKFFEDTRQEDLNPAAVMRQLEKMKREFGRRYGIQW
ncbi:MAG: DUF2380 domain-containing protein, partial [Thermaerobacter sp.]|nr:DUF2380 domain-containing protein [Thermaerobacter sp.]